MINWGDNTSSAGSIDSSGNVNGTHTYADEGTFTVNVSLSGAATDSTSYTETVADAPINVSAAGFVAFAGQNYKGTVATFSDSVSDPSATFTASIQWGDGATTAGTVSPVTWSQMNFGDASQLVAGGGKVYATFPGQGVWQYVGGLNWTRINAGDASVLAVDANGNLYGTFTGHGVWQHGSGTQWTNINTADASVLVASGGKLYGTFSGAGVWQHVSGSQWTQINGADALALTADGSGNLYGTFSGQGVWQHVSGTQWTQINSGDASVLAAVGGNLYGTFAGQGVWQYVSGSQWTQINSGDASVLAGDGNGNLYGTFTGRGAFKFISPMNWTPVSLSDATVMAGDGANLYATLKGTGVWKAVSGNSVLGSHTYTTPATDTYTVTVTDDGGSHNSSSNTVNVVRLTGASFTATQGQPFSGVVAQAAGLPTTGVNASISWGDGTTSAGSIDNSTGKISGTHTYVAGGTFTVTVSLSGSVTTSTSYQEAVTRIPISTSTGTISATAGQNYKGQLATFTPSASDTSTTFTASINWGDGSTTAGIISPVQWAQMNIGDASVIAAGGGKVYATFSGRGVWQYFGGLNWGKINAADASKLAVDGSGNVYGTFAGQGVWQHLGGTQWTNINRADASVLVADGANLYGTFAGAGVWQHVSGTQWNNINTADASVLVAAGGNLFGTFSGQGVWQHISGTQWNNINAASASVLAVDASGDLYGTFTGQGVWQYVSGTQWTRINSGDASVLAVDANGNLYGTFVGHGVFKFISPMNWAQASLSDASVMAVDGGNLYATLSGTGVWMGVSGHSVLGSHTYMTTKTFTYTVNVYDAG